MNRYSEYIGSEDQLISYSEGFLSGGGQEGVHFMQIQNGGNLSVSVLPGRCMDIYQVRYKGQNMNYLAPCGIRSGQYYDARGDFWLRNFFVGQLTTLGLQHFGPATETAGEVRGLHGRIANTAAENVTYTRFVKENGIPALSVEGTMREARIFGENLTLSRKLTFCYKEDSIYLNDTITNHGFGERQVLYALHLNYGYPLLEEGMKIFIDTDKVTPRTEEAAKYIKTWDKIEKPSYPYSERCYFHKLKKNKDGTTGYTIFNEKRKIGVKVTYQAKDFPFFCEWKMLGKGEYVLGLEPMNAFLDGPKLEEEGCAAPILGPFESREYKLKIQYIDNIGDDMLHEKI
ncbi:MAG: aldose 1-epimerase family protein [Bilifractor sp.]|jgi:hypothetical protein